MLLLPVKTLKHRYSKKPPIYPKSTAFCGRGYIIIYILGGRLGGFCLASLTVALDNGYVDFGQRGWGVHSCYLVSMLLFLFSCLYVTVLVLLLYVTVLVLLLVCYCSCSLVSMLLLFSCQSVTVLVFLVVCCCSCSFVSMLFLFLLECCFSFLLVFFFLFPCYIFFFLLSC